MRVVILNQTFHPDTAATAQLMWDLALHLKSKGHEVSAVTSRAVYGESRRFEKSRERIGGIEIIRCAQTAFGKGRLLGRMADFLSFYATALRELCALRRPDVILALTSPPMVGCLGALVKEFSPPGRRPALVCHIMDLYPDAAVAMGVLRENSVVHRAMSGLTRRTLGLSDAIITLGQDMADRIVGEYGRALADRIAVVQPWADGAALQPLEKHSNPLAAQLNVRDTFTAVYSGNLGMAHDSKTLVDAIDATRNEPMRWLFIGAGSRFEPLSHEATLRQWPHARFLPLQQRDALGASLNLADVHLVSQLPEFTGVVVPSKLFGIMAVGKPAIMVGPEQTECARLIKKHGFGFVVPNGRADVLVERLKWLRENPGMRAEMGANARHAFLASYNRPIACDRIESVLRRAAGAAGVC